MKMNFTSTQIYSNTTTPNSPSVYNTIISYFCLLVSSVFFGSNYLPVKYYETGDGMFFQFIVCIAIWTGGIIVHAVRGFPKFYSLPLLGGFIWTIGNANSVPVIKCLGIGLGSFFWNLVGLVVGWANARYGWFGVKAEVPSNIPMNYVGVILCISSICLFLFVETETTHTNLIQQIESESKLDIYDKLSTKTKRILGSSLSILSGVMFGLSITPILYVQDNYENVSQNYNDYAFSYNTGLFLGSILYFFVYCIIKKNKPDIYPEAILPGFITGWMWLIANTCFFIATNNLSQAISFPMTNCGPCCVAFLVGLIYKEIKGRKNYILVFFGILLTLSGSVLLGLSK